MAGKSQGRAFEPLTGNMASLEKSFQAYIFLVMGSNKTKQKPNTRYVDFKSAIFAVD